MKRDFRPSKGIRQASTIDIQIKLYNLLVNQLTKYNSIVWQFPVALAAANFVALEKFCDKPAALFLLGMIDIAFVFAFDKMVHQQQVIIDVTRRAEEQLRKGQFSGFIPEFTKEGIRAGNVVRRSLWGATALLILFALFRLGAFESLCCMRSCHR